MINVKNIYWMLAYAFQTVNLSDAKKISMETFDNIYDLFCFMLVQQLNKQVKKGLYKEYLLRQEELSGLKGKILISESLKENSYIKSKMVCEYDEYSSNSYLNKIVKTAAIYLLKSNRIINKEKINSLRRVLIYFQEVDIINKNEIRWNFIQYQKNNSSYRLLINISYLILNSLLANESNGQLEFREFIREEEMYRLYEKFVLEYYRYHYPELHASLPQIKWNVTDNPFVYLLPKMQTDIVLYYKDKTLIIDTKYYSRMFQQNSWFHKDTFISENLYQIYSYVKNMDIYKYGKIAGMLLYAKPDEVNDVWLPYNMDGNTIVISNVDLNCDFSKIKNKLNYIADWFCEKENVDSIVV